MAFVAASSPLPSDYIRVSPRMFFSYEPESNTFQQGYLGISNSTITGTLHVRFPSSIEAKNISLTFIGREVVEIDLMKSPAEKIIVNESIHIWKTSSVIGYEPITDLDLPFEFKVPDTAFESFTSSNGKIQYTLKAVIATKSKKKYPSVEVIVPIRRWMVPDDQDLKPLVLKSNSSSKVPLSWQAILPRTFADIDSKMPIKLRLISYNPELRIQKISTFLNTHISYKVKHKKSNTSESICHQKNKVIGKDIMMIPMGADTIFESDMMLNIPNDVIPNCETKYITVNNQIQIKITLEKSRRHVMIKRNVVVGRNWFNDKSAAASPMEICFNL